MTEERYVTMDRIGPMPSGAREGTYLEKGEVVSGDLFQDAHRAILVERGFLVPWAEGVMLTVAPEPVEPQPTAEIVPLKEAMGQILAGAADETASDETADEPAGKRGKGKAK